MTDPIPLDTLLAYAAGKLSPEQAAAVEARLAGDPEARATVARFRAIRDEVAADAAHAPPADLLARAKAIFAVHTATPWKKWLDRVDALVATLIFDSRLQPAAVRDDADDSRFQLAFESDAADVDVQAQRLAPGPGGAVRWRVMGQVAADEAVGARRVALRATGSRDARVETVTDERGLFELDADGGVYDLAIEMEGREVLLPDIRMG